jgi:hypothetical protein
VIERFRPFAAKRMRRWLDPVDGAGLAVTLRGFATVTWLQFWAHL